ncbi:phage tail-collar fiber domain-containing protein [Lacrimispora sp.]|uniref:phage tail-collar fiber domain-containing protein n=1 Tax=Lacrimispora sp. TaxID=2719234 RepID=UPI0028AA1FA9|nr:phage tail protein [Lacrimispora sp.]
MAGTVITKKGLQLIAKLVASGTALSFTRAAVGIGSVPPGYDPGSMTGLSNYKMDGLIYSCSASGDEASIVMQISSIGVTTGFTITEAGLFATDPDDGEILYAYLDMSKDPQYIYPENSAISKFVEITLIVKVGTVDKVTAYINPGSLITRDGDISETVVNTLEPFETKFPMPAAGETIKRFLGKVLTFLKNIKPLESNVAYYVATTGSDTTGDGTSAKPYKTLQYALSTLPKNLGDFGATIYLANGTYDNGTVDILGFYNGVIVIRSQNYIDALNDACIIVGMVYIRSQASVHLNSIRINTPTTPSDAIIVAQGRLVRLDHIKIVNSNLLYNAIFAASNSDVNVISCEISNHNRAVYADYSTAWVCDCTGTGNNVGLQVSSGGVIRLAGVTAPTGTVPRMVASGGQIFVPNGTQISNVFTSGMSCTWGTVQNGYVRNGNLSGSAIVTIQVGIVINTNLSSGVEYTISGFPGAYGGNAAISVSPQSVVESCFIDASGVIRVKFNKALSIPYGILFTCTYLTIS